MKPRLGKKGRKALSAKKSTKPAKKKTAKVRAAFKSPKNTKIENVKVEGSEITAILAEPAPCPEPEYTIGGVTCGPDSESALGGTEVA